MVFFGVFDYTFDRFYAIIILTRNAFDAIIIAQTFDFFD